MYFLCYLVLTAFSILSVNKNNKFIDIGTSITILIVSFLFIFFRDGLGPDEPVYLDIYTLFIDDRGDFPFDYSFYALYWLFDLMSVSKNNFNNFISLIYVFLVYLTVFKVVRVNAKSIVLLLALFSAVSIDFYFNAYRQAFSSVFLILSLYSLSRKNFVTFFTLAIISIGFHWSVVIVYVFFFLSRVLKEKIIYNLIISVFLLNFSAIFINFNILKLIHYVITFMPFTGELLTKVQFYFNSSNGDSFYDLNLMGRLVFMFPVQILLLFVLIYFDKVKAMFFVSFISLWSAFCLALLGMQYGFRNYYWMLIFFPFLFSIFIDSKRNPDNKLIEHVGVIIFLSILGFVSTFTSPILPLLYSG